MTQLKDFCKIEYGKALTANNRSAGNAKVFGSAGEVGSHKDHLYSQPLIVVGRKGNISGVYKVDGPSWVIDTAYAVLPQPQVDRDFLYYFLKHSSSQFSSHDQSTAIPSLSRDVLHSLKFIPPPLSVQTQIVRNIESLFSKVDSATFCLTNIFNKLGLYKQSILNTAIRGKLVPQDPNDEPASVLLERIIEEKKAFIAAGKIKKEKPLPPISPDEIPFELPEGWEWVRLSEICCLITSGSRGWAEYYSDSGAIFIRSQDINTDALILDNIAFVNPPRTAEGNRTRVMRNDILITITGANVGKTAIVMNKLDEAYVSQHVSLIRLVNTDLSLYIHNYLISEAHGRRILEALAYGAGKPGLNLENLRNLQVPIPPLGYQKRLVSAVRDQIQNGIKYMSIIEASIIQSQSLKMSILKNAFEGKLL